MAAASSATAHEGTCDAKPWRGMLGQSLDQLNLDALPELFRVLYPDSSRGDEPDDDRLNFVVDDTGQITDLFCG